MTTTDPDWEGLGYHRYGDPWREQRYAGIDPWTMVWHRSCSGGLRGWWTLTPETESARTIGLAVPGWGGHLAGQHIDLKLTAEDGYSAQRSYSLSRPADGERIELTVQKIADGEVSPYLTGVRPGEEIELRGPIGGWLFGDRPRRPGYSWSPADRASCR